MENGVTGLEREMTSKEAVAIPVVHGHVPLTNLVDKKTVAIVVGNPKTAGIIDLVETEGNVARITPTLTGQGERYCQWS